MTAVMVRDEFEEFQAKDGLSPEEICSFLNTPSQEVIDSASFSRALPDAYKYIMSYGKSFK